MASTTPHDFNAQTSSLSPDACVSLLQTNNDNFYSSVERHEALVKKWKKNVKDYEKVVSEAQIQIQSLRDEHQQRQANVDHVTRRMRDNTVWLTQVFTTERQWVTPRYHEGMRSHHEIQQLHAMNNQRERNNDRLVSEVQELQDWISELVTRVEEENRLLGAAARSPQGSVPTTPRLQTPALSEENSDVRVAVYGGSITCDPPPSLAESRVSDWEIEADPDLEDFDARLEASFIQEPSHEWSDHGSESDYTSESDNAFESSIAVRAAADDDVDAEYALTEEHPADPSPLLGIPDVHTTNPQNAQDGSRDHDDDESQARRRPLQDITLASTAEGSRQRRSPFNAVDFLTMLNREPRTEIQGRRPLREFDTNSTAGGRRWRTGRFTDEGEFWMPEGGRPSQRENIPPVIRREGVRRRFDDGELYPRWF